VEFKINKHSILSGITLMCTYVFFVAANKFTTSANAIVLQYSAAYPYSDSVCADIPSEVPQW
jgi:hypothetical protein